MQLNNKNPHFLRVIFSNELTRLSFSRALLLLFLWSLHVSYGAFL
jgi:hypothetical protein